MGSYYRKTEISMLAQEIMSNLRLSIERQLKWEKEKNVDEIKRVGKK